MSDSHPTSITEDWWDGRKPDSFFPYVYYQGDDSREGFLNRIQLSQSARTVRECDLVAEEFRDFDPSHTPSTFRVLDCPCGEGRHSIELARRGYEVVGADLCPKAVKAAREALARESEDVRRRCSFVEADMRSLKNVGDSFSAVINMFFSFGFFSADGNQATLRCFHTALASHGLLLIHTDVNRHLIDSAQYGDRSIRTLPDGSKLTILEHWNELTNRLEGSWTIAAPSGSSRSASYSVRIFTSTELQAKLAASGFNYLGEKALPIFTQKLPVHQSQELFYLAMKP